MNFYLPKCLFKSLNIKGRWTSELEEKKNIVGIRRLFNHKIYGDTRSKGQGHSSTNTLLNKRTHIYTRPISIVNLQVKNNYACTETHTHSASFSIYFVALFASK